MLPSNNYFKLFNLPVSFNIDKDKLKREYYNLSKSYHTDIYDRLGGGDNSNNNGNFNNVNKFRSNERLFKNGDKLSSCIDKKLFIDDYKSLKETNKFNTDKIKFNNIFTDKSKSNIKNIFTDNSKINISKNSDIRNMSTDTNTFKNINMINTNDTLNKNNITTDTTTSNNIKTSTTNNTLKDINMIINKGYKTLNDDLKRARYLNKDTAEMDKSFLLEILDLEEQIQESNNIDNLNLLKNKIEKEIDICRRKYFDKIYLSRWQYFDRLKKLVDKKIMENDIKNLK